MLSLLKLPEPKHTALRIRHPPSGFNRSSVAMSRLRALLCRHMCMLVRTSAWIFEAVISRDNAGMSVPGGGELVTFRAFLLLLEGMMVQRS